MVLDLSMMSVASFLTTILLLAVYSILDVRDRRVRNGFVFLGCILGSIVLLLTGHYIQNMLLHLTSLLMVIPLVYILFRLGSIGGADAKVLFTITLLSPGIELGDWGEPILEAVIGLGGEIVLMLLGGYLFWRYKNKEGTPPLIPFLFVGYLVMQILAML
ncbi:MAG: prepilin peptidase [Candidatus Thorarchaeota archaeon]